MKLIDRCTVHNNSKFPKSNAKGKNVGNLQRRSTSQRETALYLAARAPPRAITTRSDHMSKERHHESGKQKIGRKGFGYFSKITWRITRLPAKAFRNSNMAISCDFSY